MKDKEIIKQLREILEREEKYLPRDKTVELVSCKECGCFLPDTRLVYAVKGETEHIIYQDKPMCSPCAWVYQQKEMIRKEQDRIKRKLQ